MRTLSDIRFPGAMVLAVVVALGVGGASNPVGAQTKGAEPEDLTEHKIVAPKDDYVAGVERGAQDLFRRGVEAVSKTPPEYGVGEKAFQDALAKDKGFAEAYFNLAMIYERTGRPEEAIKVYQKAEQALPEKGEAKLDKLDAQAAVQKVQLLMAKKARDSGDVVKAGTLETEARRVLEAVIAKDPDSVTANNALAMYFLQRNDPKTAEDYVKKVLIEQPKNVMALNNRGLINLLAGKLSIARWVFEEKTLREDPNSTEAWANLGLTYMKMNKTPQAVASFEKAVAADASNVDARMNIAAVYLQFLHYQAALEQYDVVLKFSPNSVEALIGRGSCQEGLHQPKEAIASWEKALKLDPARGAVLYARIGSLYELVLNDMDKAIAAYQEYVRIAKPGKEDKIASKLPVLIQMKNAPKVPDPVPEPAPAPKAEAPKATPPAAAPAVAPAPAPAAKADVKKADDKKAEAPKATPPVAAPAVAPAPAPAAKADDKKADDKKADDKKADDKKARDKKGDKKVDAAPAPAAAPAAPAPDGK